MTAGEGALEILADGSEQGGLFAGELSPSSHEPLDDGEHPPGQIGFPATQHKGNGAVALHGPSARTPSGIRASGKEKFYGLQGM